MSLVSELPHPLRQSRPAERASTVLGALTRLYRVTWWAMALRGLLALAVGVFVFARPLDSVAALALVVAWWALFSGVVEVVHAIELAPSVKPWWVPLVSGLAGIGLGVCALVYYPVLSLAFLVVWTAGWLMCVGLLGAGAAIVQRSVALPWGWTMVFGVLSVAAALFALTAPPITLGALLALIGGLAVANGTTLLVGAFRLRALVRG